MLNIATNPANQQNQLIPGVSFLLLTFLNIPEISAANGNIYLRGSAGASFLQFSNINPEISHFDGYLIDSYPLDKKQTLAPYLV